MPCAVISWDALAKHSASERPSSARNAKPEHEQLWITTDALPDLLLGGKPTRVVTGLGPGGPSRFEGLVETLSYLHDHHGYRVVGVRQGSFQRAGAVEYVLCARPDPDPASPGSTAARISGAVPTPLTLAAAAAGGAAVAALLLVARALRRPRAGPAASSRPAHSAQAPLLAKGGDGATTAAAGTDAPALSGPARDQGVPAPQGAKVASGADAMAHEGWVDVYKASHAGGL